MVQEVIPWMNHFNGGVVFGRAHIPVLVVIIEGLVCGAGHPTVEAAENLLGRGPGLPLPPPPRMSGYVFEYELEYEYE